MATSWFILLLSVLAALPMLAQDAMGPEIPIVLEHADSLVGTGLGGTSVRTFVGNVRFSQGNVTGQCDRAVHDAARNTVELSGSVRIRQKTMTISAPSVVYDGATSFAQANRGIRVDQDGRIITSVHGDYDLQRHIATFHGNVHVVDDTVRLWSDSLHYDRDRDSMMAMGRVLIQDSINHSWFSANAARRSAQTAIIELLGDARVWTWSKDSTTLSDTTYIQSDVVQSLPSPTDGSRVVLATGNVRLVRGTTAAVAGRLQYVDETGRIDLHDSPTVWSDSSILQAVAISAESSAGALQQVIGNGKAILLSVSDSLVPIRYDQIGGNSIVMRFGEDSTRTLQATGEAVSITYRRESGLRKGLAKVVADTINANIIDGSLEDVFWLGGVSGESHPERLVTGREAEFVLPSFREPGMRPQFVPVPSRQSLLR
jgi:lipopolysaccharide export system protein LptA